MNTTTRDAILSSTGTLATRIKDQKPHDDLKSLPVFYRNLEEALDLRRAASSFYSIVSNYWQTSNAIDLCSGDILSLGASEVRRAEFMAELNKNPAFSTGSSGVRLMDGNYAYLEQAEKDIAKFHGTEAGILVGGAYEANIAVWTAIPRPGDVIVYDELVHASTHEGMKQSVALQKVEFAHSNIDAFRQTLLEVFRTQPSVRRGRSSILVAVESIYSMDGDVCPLQELVDVADEISNGMGNIQFVVDEAHSVGVIGPKGAGLVCELGLQSQIAVVVHSYGKAMGAAGGVWKNQSERTLLTGAAAVILGSQTIRRILSNFGKSIIYTTSPSYPFVAAIKSGYNLLERGYTEKGQQHIQALARCFFQQLTENPLWDEARESGLLSVPLWTEWEDRPFLTHIVTLTTRQKYTWWLHYHLLDSSFCVFPVDHPVVPLGKGRLRVIFHAFNTEEEIVSFVNAIFCWVEEMIELEARGEQGAVSRAAQTVYAWMRVEGLTGFGMP